MEVSFTGMRNLGHTYIYVPPLNSPLKRIVCELTDEGNKDLSEFREILKQFPDSLNKNFLRFDILHDSQTDKALFRLNNKELPLADENLGILQKISKLYSRILNGEEVKTSQDYLDCEESVNNLLDGLIEIQPPEASSIFKKTFPTRDCHEELHIKYGAEDMVKEIDNAIQDYLYLEKPSWNSKK